MYVLLIAFFIALLAPLIRLTYAIAARTEKLMDVKRQPWWLWVVLDLCALLIIPAVGYFMIILPSGGEVSATVNIYTTLILFGLVGYFAQTYRGPIRSYRGEVALNVLLFLGMAINGVMALGNIAVPTPALYGCLPLLGMFLATAIARLRVAAAQLTGMSEDIERATSDVLDYVYEETGPSLPVQGDADAMARKLLSRKWTLQVGVYALLGGGIFLTAMGIAVLFDPLAEVVAFLTISSF